MRTSGVYTVSQLKCDGYELIDSWRAPYLLNRDWTQEEAEEICMAEHHTPVVFHNHIVNWNHNLLKKFKQNGWLTFSIVRDPREQLCSLYGFQLKKSEDIENPSLDEFIKQQVTSQTSLNIDCEHWAVPEWWKEIDIILHHEEEMFPILQRYFDVQRPLKRRINAVTHLSYQENLNLGNISEETNKLLLSSQYYERYKQLKGKSMKLLFLITSCQKNDEARRALRQTWLKDLDHQYYFVVGRPGAPTEVVGDILYIDCGDTYLDCPIKQYLSIKYVAQHFEFDRLFCCDDDTYIMVSRMLDCDFAEHDYYGGGPVDMHGEPFYVQGGAGIFLSPRAVQAVVDYPQDGEHIKCRWSDQMMGRIMHDAGIEPKYNTRFQMGHEEIVRPISRDHNRVTTSHKLSPDQIREADIDINPFHVFDKIYWLQSDVRRHDEMISQLQDADIVHLVTPFEGDIKDAVRDSKICNAERILILTDQDVFKFHARNLARYLFRDVRDWRLMALGAEAQRGHWHTTNTVKSSGVRKFSGLGIHSEWFDSLLEHEGTIEEWLQGKEVIFPKRIAAVRRHDYFMFPEIVPETEVETPIKCAMIVNNFKRGGAEVEFNEMLTRLDPQKVQWVGLAVESAFQFEISPLYKEKFPPVYVNKKHEDEAIDLDGIHVCDTFEEAVLRACQDADVVVKWHLCHPMVEVLPHPSIALSNAFGRWVLNEYKKIRSNMQVGNSDHSGTLFWNGRARTIYSGHAIERLQTQLGREKQREKWGFGPEDKVIGYTGRVDMNKNLGTVIKAVSLLPEEYKLAFVGQPVRVVFEEVQSMLEQYLPGRYVVDEWSHHVGDALSGLDCFVLVSEYEGFSNSLAEAWMMDVPAVFSRCGAVMELENKYGNIGISTNLGVTPRDLSNYIREAMGEANKPNVEKIGKIIRDEFTIEKSARAWEQAIEDLYKQFQPHKKLKACVLLPNLDFGGTEVWLSTLMKCSQRCLIEWSLVKPAGELKTNPKILEELLPYGKFHLEEEIDMEHPNLFTYKNKPEMNKVFLNSDVIVVWGIEDFANWFPKIDKPIVVISKCHPEDTFHADILEKNAPLATRFAAVSCEAMNAYPEIIRKSVNIIPNGFLPDHTFSDKSKEEQKQAWGLSKDDIVIGFVGRWCKEKNPLALGKVISALPEEYKGVYVGVTHSGPWSCEEEHYKEDMDKFLSREDQERRLKYIDVQHKIGDTMKGIDVLLMPSEKEGFCLVLIEAWAAGVPVVSTNVGVFKDMYQMFGFPFGQVIDPHDGGDVMSHKIKAALEMTPEELLEIKGHVLYRFNGITTAHRWLEYLHGLYTEHKHYSIEPPLSEKLKVLLTKSSPKKVARELNMKGVPVPDGSPEWTYKSVLAFSAAS